MVEVVSVEEGFRVICHAPDGKELRETKLQSHPYTAWKVGLEQIDYFLLAKH